LLFTKGKPLKRMDKNVDQLVVSHLREHSRKPDEVKDKIHRLFGDVPKIELFAREQYDPEHWDYWGNEINKFDNEEEELMIEVDLDD
jgi:N6-adenosine-specific RNA methylase IME4